MDRLNEKMARLESAERVGWAVRQFGNDAGLSSSFGADSAVMLHLATRVKPDLKVITLDTGYLFPETITFRDELTRRLGLNLHVYKMPVSGSTYVDEHGDTHLHNPADCCTVQKAQHFDRAKAMFGIRCWMTGIRRQQTQTRSDTPFVLRDHLGLVKVCPIADWTDRDVHHYLKQHDLPYHPLRAHGYLSIGCMPCTRKAQPDGDPRSGRWADTNTTECGLHLHDQGSGI